jgi:hypothetical protein
MRRLFCLSLGMLLLAAVAEGAWKKAYFGATPPGSWARYTDRVTGENASSMTSTSTRLADDGGRPRIEVLTEFGNAQYPPSTTVYTLSKTFDLTHDLIDLGKGLVAVGTAYGGATTTLPDATVQLMRKGMPEYGPVVSFREEQKIDGRSCDHYAYVIRRQTPQQETETGELWLSDAVPFGLVRQSATTTNAQRRAVQTYERKLATFGLKQAAATPVVAAAAPALSKALTPPTAPTPSKAPAPSKAGAHTLKEAFDQGLIGITADVDASVKNGEKVRLHIESKDETGFTLVIPKGATSLHVGIPLGDFMFEVATSQTFQLTGEKPADITVKQTGRKRVLDGAFRISVYEGTPLFGGSATVGFVK